MIIAPLLITALFTLLQRVLESEDLRRIPGPISFTLGSWRIAYEDWRGERVRSIKRLHDKYGPVVRVGSNEISFNSLSALRTIYGAGNNFERTSFYRMFDAYGRANLFTFGPVEAHRARKRLLSHAYSNQTILASASSSLIQEKVALYLRLLEENGPNPCNEIFSSLHYFSIDTISDFVFGPDFGGTKALQGDKDRALLNDILDPARRKLAWFVTHLPRYTKWVVSQKGLMELLVNSLGLLPMKKPTTYSGIRAHALKACECFMNAPVQVQASFAERTVIGRLKRYQERDGLSDLDIASECADHLLAGIDTTADSLMFLIWALSLPRNLQYQEKLRAELGGVSFDAQTGVPLPKSITRLPYLNAVIKETLRLYSPLPATEPRSSPVDTVIDGYRIPAGTVVGMSPYCLHREASVFPNPTLFNPERWLENPESTGNLEAMNHWFWAFSSGGRMCIGMHLANAEMATLVAAVYKRYRTTVREKDVTPGITSRFEVFYDETMPRMVEHECWINFEKVATCA
jgi:cytochrome P450